MTQPASGHLEDSILDLLQPDLVPGALIKRMKAICDSRTPIIFS